MSNIGSYLIALVYISIVNNFRLIVTWTMNVKQQLKVFQVC